MAQSEPVPTLTEFRRTLIGAADAVYLRVSCFNDLAALFGAIGRAAEDREAHTARDLANLGQYLAEDWGALATSTHKDITNAVEVLK